METVMLDATQTLADLVLDHPASALVLHRHRIDFCCQGGRSIEAAASARGLDPDALLEELSQAAEGRASEHLTDPREVPTPRLIDHIVSTHHEYLRRSLPFVQMLAAKVSRVHGDSSPELHELEPVVDALASTLLPHLDEEERSLFPALVAETVDGAHVRERLDAMAEDHLAVAGLLERVREITDDFDVPAWACSSYRMLYWALAQLDVDVRTHVHLENHVLAPRFVTSAR